jgi:hypothetical protein
MSPRAVAFTPLVATAMRPIVSAVALLAVTAAPAIAADGCRFLLCIAGPWQSIPECRPTVLEVFRQTALGRPFPTCELSGEGSQAFNAGHIAGTCPDMYKVYNDLNGRYLRCTYRWKVDVFIDGYGLWSTVHWDKFGTSTWYSESARQQLGADALDPKYDQDLDEWSKANPPPGGGGGGEG